MCDQAKIQSETIKSKLLLLRPAKMSRATFQMGEHFKQHFALQSFLPASAHHILREIVAKLNHFSGKVCEIEPKINVWNFV